MCRRSRKRARTASLARCVSAWNCIARTRSAPRAISAWIRWGSRSKISTRWANGARKAMARRIDASASLPDGTRFEGVARPARACWPATKKISCARSRRNCWRMPSAAASNTTDLPAIRKIARDAAPQDYRWSGIILRDCQQHAVQHEYGRRRHAGEACSDRGTNREK